MNVIKQLRLRTARPHRVHYKHYDDICAASVVPYGDRIHAWVPLVTVHLKKQVGVYSLHEYITDLKGRYPDGTVTLCFEEPLANCGFKQEWITNNSYLSAAIGRTPTHIVTTNTDFLTAPPFDLVSLRLDAPSDVARLDIAALKNYRGRVEYICSSAVYRAILARSEL